jgi:two-component system, response regulator PdtaR
MSTVLDIITGLGAPEPLVLLVVDDLVLRKAISMELQGRRYRVVETGDAEEAIRRSTEDSPAVVVTDCRLPTMSGIDLSSKIIANHYVPIILLSSLAQEGTVSQALEAGVFGCLRKPIDPPQLIPIVQAAMHQAQALRAAWQARRGGARPGEDESRTINIVTGILMERFNLSHQAAYGRLRQYARNQRNRIVDVAGTILSASDNANLLLTAINAAKG